MSFVKKLVDQRVPIDGVGFQGHLLVGKVPTKETLVKVLTAFTNLGLEVAIVSPVRSGMFASLNTNCRRPSLISGSPSR